MKRFTIALALVFGLLASFAVPDIAKAETAVNCTDQYASCLNSASAYIDAPVLRTMAETECGFEYAGCVARKLKFW